MIDAMAVPLHVVDDDVEVEIDVVEFTQADINSAAAAARREVDRRYRTKVAELEQALADRDAEILRLTAEIESRPSLTSSEPLTSEQWSTLLATEVTREQFEQWRDAQRLPLAKWIETGGNPFAPQPVAMPERPAQPKFNTTPPIYRQALKRLP